MASIKLIRSFLVILVLLSSCTSEVDLCTLLNIQEIQQLNRSVRLGSIERRLPNTPNANEPVNYCVWRGDDEREVLLVAAGVATKNTSVEIFKFVFGDTARVITIYDVGNDAAAVFSHGTKNSQLKYFSAQNQRYRIEVVAPGVGDENSEEFRRVKSLAGLALTRLQ